MSVDRDDGGDAPEFDGEMEGGIEGRGERDISLAWEGCGIFMALAARIDVRLAFLFGDGIAEFRQTGVGMTADELQIMNDYGPDDGMIRVGCERLSVRLDGARPAWMAAHDVVVAAGQTAVAWNKLQRTLGVAQGGIKCKKDVRENDTNVCDVSEAGKGDERAKKGRATVRGGVNADVKNVLREMKAEEEGAVDLIEVDGNVESNAGGEPRNACAKNGSGEAREEGKVGCGF